MWICRLIGVCVALSESKRWNCVEGLWTNVDEEVSRSNGNPGLWIVCWKETKGKKVEMGVDINVVLLDEAV